MLRGKSQMKILLGFLLVLILVDLYMGIPIEPLITDTLIRLPMNGLFVLSLLPMLNTGMGFNFGMPVGILGGLLGISTVMNFKIRGMWGFICAILLTMLICTVFGKLYGKILVKASGKEEISGNFLGLSLVPLFCIVWITIPFKNPVMIYPVGGKGLRPKIGLDNYFNKIIEDMLKIKIGNLTIPLGYLLCFFAVCGLIYFLFKSSLGENMMNVGENEEYCSIMGLPVEKIKKQAVMVSTILAGIGICFYSQSYGYLELYNAPKSIAFSAVSALLIGGCTETKGKISHVILGTVIFHGIYVFSIPLANKLFIPELAEICRTILTNVIILFAMLGTYKKEKRLEKNRI